MNNFIIEEIARELDIKVKQVETVLKLLEEGNTIPFIEKKLLVLWMKNLLERLMKYINIKLI